MQNKHLNCCTGLSLVELVIAIGLILVIFGGISLAYSSILDSIVNTSVRAAAAAVLSQQVEIIRNLPYGSVGTVGGIPAGVIAPTQTIVWDANNFVVTTIVRNIDDPFDGTLTSVPKDTAPADYKLVQLQISCTNCTRFFPLTLTTYVAPKNLESATTQGSLAINVLDANGNAVSSANVRVVNANTAPSIDLTDTTNASGTLLLVGVPTSTQKYRISVSLPGYSSERTYAPGDPQNPNPVKPDATVAAGTLTQLTFAIDKGSKLTAHTSDAVCSAIGNKNFSISGAKLIGTNPNILKFSTSTATDASGTKVFANMEWDTYSLAVNEPSYDIAGTIPFTPFTINPGGNYDFRFVMAPANPDSLLVTVEDAASGNIIPNASVILQKTGFSKTLTTGRNFLTNTDWSGGKYSSQDGGIEADASPGKLTLKLSGSSYPTSTTHWLISNTFDVGSSSSAFYSLSWNPTSQPPASGPQSVAFQIAANNDGTTWNFTGPDGTPNSYYAQSGASLGNQYNNNRYIRYKVFLETDDSTVTPEIGDVSIEFSSVCVPPSQTLFTGLSAGNYSLIVDAVSYPQTTSTVSVGGAWQQIMIPMAAQ